MNVLNGLAGASGFGSGRAVVKCKSKIIPQRRFVQNSEAEIKRFREAQIVCEKRIQERMKKAGELGKAAAEIFTAHRAILNDEAFFQGIFSRVESEKLNIEFLIYDEFEKITARFEAVDDQLLRERAADIEQVCHEVIGILYGVDGSGVAERDKALSKCDENTIIVSYELTPAEAIGLDKRTLKGFVTEKGGVTSHTVILAKALGIPAITGVRGAADVVKSGDYLLIDGCLGRVIVNPDGAKVANFMLRSAEYARKQAFYAEYFEKKALTLDGHRIDVGVNSGDEQSIKGFEPNRCDGIGLLRTEFLYMSRSEYPDEQVQYEIYGGLAFKAGGKEVVIRTLDMGGDKQAPYMALPQEENPFLGYRAIRICLDRRELFHTQLRAILRASAHGNVKIMFPMIINLEELRTAKQCVERAKCSLKEQGIPFNEHIEVGIMIETPAAVLISDKLAREADFFSIGSNDLVQYVTAADRKNERVNKLYDNCNISVLRAIKMVSESAGKAQIPWGICGEVASEALLLPVWAAFGVSKLSVAPALVGRVKYGIGQLSRLDVMETVKSALNQDTAAGARRELDALLAQLGLV